MRLIQRGDSRRQTDSERKHTVISPRVGALGLTAVMVSALLPIPAAAAAAWGWQGAVSIESENGGVYDAQVGYAADGTAVAMWYQFGNLYWNRYTPVSGWGTAALVETNDTAFVRYSAFAASRNGDAVASWVYPGSGADFVYANTYRPSAGWGLPFELHPGGTGYASDTSVAVNSRGVATAAWAETGPGFVTDIWAARFTTTGGWEAPTIVDTGAGNAFSPDVVVDDGGNALLVWDQQNGSFEEVFGAYYVNGVGWGAPETVARNDSADEVQPDVAFSYAGDALVVWNEVGASWNVLGSAFTPFVGWEAPALVEHRDVGRASTPRLAMDAYDNGCAVWLELGAGSERDAWQNCYQKGFGWGQEALIERNDLYPVVAATVPVDIAMDDFGGAIATWAQSDGVEVSAWAAQRERNGDWQEPVLLETMTGGSAARPAVAKDPNGNGMAVWGQDIGTHSRVMANAFVVRDAWPPFLFVSGPGDGATTNVSSVLVSGYTDFGARVLVSGLEAAVAADGTFSVRVALEPGLNYLVVQALDAAGNPSTLVIAVTYEDPVPGLEAELGAAQAGLQSAVENLSVARARLDSLTADANATEAELGAAQADLTSAQARLTASEAAASALAAQFSDARALLNQTRVELAAAQVELAAARTQINATNTTARPPAPAADLGPAIALGLAGVALGGGGLVMGVQSARRAMRPPEP